MLLEISNLSMQPAPKEAALAGPAKAAEIVGSALDMVKPASAATPAKPAPITQTPVLRMGSENEPVGGKKQRTMSSSGVLPSQLVSSLFYSLSIYIDQYRFRFRFSLFKYV